MWPSDAPDVRRLQERASEMADRTKRKRADPPTRFGRQAPAHKLQNAPPARFLGRTCRVRWPQTDKWVTATLAAYGGSDRQTTCKLELHEGVPPGVAPQTSDIDLASQPIHVADMTVWGPDDGRKEGVAADTGPAGSPPFGGYVSGLVPMVVFTPLGPPELEAEDGHVLAQSLKTGKHTWIEREGTRPLAVHMMRRNQRGLLKKAVDAALEMDRALKAADMKTKKRGIVGKRLAIYWPDDDMWYNGVVQSYDQRAARHMVLHDDGVSRGALNAPALGHQPGRALSLTSDRTRTHAPHQPTAGPSPQPLTPSSPTNAIPCRLRRATCSTRRMYTSTRVPTRSWPSICTRSKARACTASGTAS